MSTTGFIHPCLRCGACCATFRVAMHWSETDPALGGVVPVELTEPLRTHERVMRGTHHAPVRCVALAGDVGGDIRCSIHPQRPQACRNVAPSFEGGGGASAQCDRARIAHGMEPLTAADWPR